MSFPVYLFGTPGNEPILLGLVNAVLDQARRPLVNSVETLNPFDPAKFITDKYTILDVKATDLSGKIFAIEFQTAEHASFAERLLYYWARTYARQLQSGEAYKTLPQVISIAVVGFLLFKELPKLFNSFYITAEDAPEYVLTEDLQIHTIEAANEKIGKIAKLNEPLRRWANFFYFADKKGEADMKVSDCFIFGGGGQNGSPT